MSDYKTATEAITRMVRKPCRNLVDARVNAMGLLSPEHGFYLVAIVSEDGGKNVRCWPFYHGEVWDHTTSHFCRTNKIVTECIVQRMLCPGLKDHMLIEWHIRGTAGWPSKSEYANLYKNKAA